MMIQTRTPTTHSNDDGKLPRSTITKILIGAILISTVISILGELTYRAVDHQMQQREELARTSHIRLLEAEATR